MNISIIISGNLTGFSQFYASPDAANLYNQARFDFDYRNYVTFLDSGQKAYAIAFSPRVIAVSLITRILDSFRRAGILVVTALIPRNQLVHGNLSAKDKAAIYRLLNEINDRFYERNFVAGMVNQNPSVLMQDYYTDIISNYNLQTDGMQKPVNLTTDDTTQSNKRIGYVKADERDIPKYLSTPYRKSYEGFHQVFLAPNAPQNIDEPAEEVVTYKVEVEGRRTPHIGEVRLDDRIPNVQPEIGEQDIPNKNFTYRQVLNGEAGRDIIASIENGDTILLTFRFPQEEKTIHFKFFDKDREVSFHDIRPYIIEPNGNRYPLSSDSWTFRGNEIYSGIRLESGNPDYSIEFPHVDISRLRDNQEYSVMVSKGWIWKFNPIDKKTRTPVKLQPIDITLVNRVTGERRELRDITSGPLKQQMPGNEHDWTMIISSQYYKSVESAPNGNFELVRKQTDQNSEDQIHSGHRDTNEIKGHRIGGKNNSLAKETSDIEKEKKKKIILFSLLGFLICAGIACAIAIPTGCEREKDKEILADNEGQSGEVNPEDLIEENFIFDIQDESASSNLSIDNLELLGIIVSPLTKGVTVAESHNNSVKIITYNPKNKQDSINIKVILKNETMDGSPIVFYDTNWAVAGLSKDVTDLKIPVLNSELSSYRELKNNIIPKNLDSQINRLLSANQLVFPYAKLLAQLKEKVKPVTPAEPVVSNPIDQPQVRKIYDNLDIDPKNLTPNAQYPGEAARKQALNNVLGKIRNYEIPESSDINNLSVKQQRVVKEYIEYKGKLDSEGSNLIGKFKSGLKKKENSTSLQQVHAYVNQFKNDNLNQ